MPKIKTIKMDYITKIEGHAKLNIRIRNRKITKVELGIFEGSRFFEGILKGKKYNDLSPVSSRICGVCSPAHGLAALKAVENAFQIKISEQTNLLREMMHLGGIIQSHVLHLYFLALPDYYGFNNAIQMASKHKDKILKALRLKQLGNAIVTEIGGRDVHPFTAVVGGFSRLPKQETWCGLLEKLKRGRRDALDTLKLFLSLKYPEFSRCSNYFSVKNSFYDGEISCLSCEGLCSFPTKEYDKHMQEYFQEGSTSEFVLMEGKVYTVGALARLNVNCGKLNERYKNLLNKLNLPNYSPFMNNVAQAFELIECIDRCIEIIETLKLKEEKLPAITPRAAIGIGLVEAPRGMLFHKYAFDHKGYCKYVNITTPTSQNLKSIESDIRTMLPTILYKDEKNIQLDVEKLIRAYDPCISCSTHFLKINWDKR